MFICSTEATIQDAKADVEKYFSEYTKGQKATIIAAYINREAKTEIAKAILHLSENLDKVGGENQYRLEKIANAISEASHDV